MTPVEIAIEIKKLSPEELMELMTILVNHFMTLTADKGPDYRKDIMSATISLIGEQIK